MELVESIVVNADPDTVWQVAGDVANVADWVPAIERSHLEGDLRHATFANGGGDATERIVERDDAARYYVYEYVTGPLPLESYRSRLSVSSAGDGGSEVTWSAEFRAGSPEAEAELRTAISGIYRAALEELAARFTS